MPTKHIRPSRPSTFRQFTIRQRKTIRLPQQYKAYSSIHTTPTPYSSPMPMRSRPSHHIQRQTTHTTTMLKLSKGQDHVRTRQQVPFQRQTTNHTSHQSDQTFHTTYRNQHITTTKQVIQFLQQSPLRISSNQEPPSKNLTQSQPRTNIHWTQHSHTTTSTHQK